MVLENFQDGQRSAELTMIDMCWINQPIFWNENLDTIYLRINNYLPFIFSCACFWGDLVNQNICYQNIAIPIMSIKRKFIKPCHQWARSVSNLMSEGCSYNLTILQTTCQLPSRSFSLCGCKDEWDCCHTKAKRDLILSLKRKMRIFKDL